MPLEVFENWENEFLQLCLSSHGIQQFGNAAKLQFCDLLAIYVTILEFLPETKPTGLVEAMSVCPSVRPSVAFSPFGQGISTTTRGSPIWAISTWSVL